MIRSHCIINFLYRQTCSMSIIRWVLASVIMITERQVLCRLFERNAERLYCGTSGGQHCRAGGYRYGFLPYEGMLRSYHNFLWPANESAPTVYDEFPSLRKRDLHIGGLSYAVRDRNSPRNSHQLNSRAGTIYSAYSYSDSGQESST